MSELAVKVENLSKLYHIGARQERYATLRSALVSGVKRLTTKRSAKEAKANTLWALKDVSFEVKQGEVVGIIGRNGAGKSTLLKVLAHITEPTKGRVSLYGRVGSLLEVGTGFHPELTGRDNIYLNGAILGMRRAEIERKFDEIVAFAEVEIFLDTPVKRYSSGMYVRLAFAVAAHLEPEILVVDEVLAVGDAAFQRKCLGKMGDISKEGRTVMFVSHNMSAIRQLCPRSLWMHEGELRQADMTAQVVDNYLRALDYFKLGKAESVFEEKPESLVQYRVGRVTNQAGVLTQGFTCDDPIIVELICQVRQPIRGLYGYFHVYKADGTSILMSDSWDVVPNPLDSINVGKYLTRIIVPPRTLAPGDYYVRATLASMADSTTYDSVIACSFHLDDFTSRRGNERPGFFSTLLSWDVSRLPEPYNPDNIFRGT